MAKRILNPNKVIQHIAPTSPRWLSTEEAAFYLGCSPNFLEKDRQHNLYGIPYSRLGRCIKYDIYELDNYLENNKNIGANK